MADCNIKFEDVLLDDEAFKFVKDANKRAFYETYEYFSFNGYVFMTMPPSVFDADKSKTGFEEADLVGYPTDEVVFETLQELIS